MTTSTPDGTRAAHPYMNPYLAGIGLGLVLLSAFVVMGRGLGAFRCVLRGRGLGGELRGSDLRGGQ